MLAKILSATSVGFEPVLVEVEAYVSRGFPQMTIVGLGDAAIQEAKDRVRAALQNAGFKFPEGRITINLAPADLKKEGPGFDLPLALSLIKASEGIEMPHDALFIGELSLAGEVRGVSGILNTILLAKEKKIPRIYVPKENFEEACLIAGPEVIPVQSLTETLEYIEGKKSPPAPSSGATRLEPEHDTDFVFIMGQEQAKRALEIAATGGHNVFLSGPPGSGKTIMAKTMISILPRMSEEEVITATRIWSVAGALNSDRPLVSERPFRSPHHSSSTASIVGGGRIPRPGEVSLATCGLLFLDELPEFARESIESLRQPLEDRVVTISRVHGNVTFPANFILVAAQNPCPCGYFGDDAKECVCSAYQRSQYQKKISGPVLDRMDLFVWVPRLKFSKLRRNGELSKIVRERVERARYIQHERFQGTKVRLNSEMRIQEIEKFCEVPANAKSLLEQAVDTLHLSPRGYFRLLKVARSIADLEGSEFLTSSHIAEALQYRPPA